MNESRISEIENFLTDLKGNLHIADGVREMAAALRRQNAALIGPKSASAEQAHVALKFLEYAATLDESTPDTDACRAAATATVRAFLPA